MSTKDDVLVALGAVGAAIAGLILVAQAVNAKSSQAPQTSSAPSGINYIPASQANNIGASAVVGSEVAVSGNSTYTDVPSVQQIASQPSSFTLGINNSNLTISLSGAPTNQVIQVYNTQTGQLIFNMMGDGTTTYEPALPHGTYVAISLNTKQASNTVTV